MVKDSIHGWLGLPPYYIRAVGMTGELAVMATPQAQQTIDSMHSKQWRNEVAPRVLFSMLHYKPSSRAHQLTIPVLVCIAKYDRELPVDVAREIAVLAPHGEFISYPFTHFEFYRPEVLAEVVRDQIVFLKEHLIFNRRSTKKR
jgi:hypothetical protein